MARRSAPSDSVSIRPGVGVLSVLKHLNYKPWFALAEFVDNSVQSFLDHRADIRRIDGRNATLRISIDIAAELGGRITIRDNAAGIHKKDFSRAFRAAEVPPESSGLSEFGMGMKSAACWFAPIWSVRTKALGEEVEKTVSFDMKSIVRDAIEELDVATRKVDARKHYTEITLLRLHGKAPQNRTLGKIREHLAGIFRMFLRDGILELRLNGENLTYEAPATLKAPYHKNVKGKPVVWRKNIELELGGGRRVSGFAALRETASTSDAGFALFRRRRLIQGSGDEGYRPEAIFGASNSYVYQRLFGELELTGFNVSHTKDGFRWGEEEDVLLQKLKAAIAKEPLPLLDQALHHRVKLSKRIAGATVNEIAKRTAEAIEGNAPKVLDRLEAAGTSTVKIEALRRATTMATRNLQLRHEGSPWEVQIELSNDPAVGDWLEVADRAGSEIRGKKDGVRRLQIRFAVDHPFTTAFAGANAELLEPQLRIAAALALAEVVARDSGVRGAGTIRRNVNDLLRNALSKI